MSTTLAPAHARPAIRWRMWLPVALLWLVYLAVVLAIYVSHSNGAGDYAYYDRGARRLVAGQDLYADLAPNDYIGPPLLVMVLAPLAAVMDFRALALVWLGVNVAALFGAMAALTRCIHGERARLIFWLAPIFLAPTLLSLWHGQVTPILFALTAGAWIAAREKRPVLAGAMLAVGAWIKFYPGLLLLYFLWKREWRVVLGGIVAGLVLGLLQMIAVGPEVFFGYFTHVLPPLLSDGQPNLSHSNSSVLGFALRLFADVPQVTPITVSPVLFSLTRWGLTALLLGVTVWIISRPIPLARTPERKFDQEYALVTLDALLLGSTLWISGILSTLLVYVLLLREAPRHSAPRLILWGVLAAALINLHLFITLGYLQPPSDHTLPALALSMPFFGLMILWVLVVIRGRQEERNSKF